MANLIKATSNFITGRPNVWFFGGFRCGVWLIFVYVVYFVRYKNRKYMKNRCFMLG